MSGNRAEITGRVQGGFHEALTRAGQSADNIVIGDTDHGSRAVRDFLSSDQAMRTLAESGVSHVCLEVPKEFNSLAKDYQSGTITAEQFIDRFSARHVYLHSDAGELTNRDYAQSLVTTMDNAKRYGMEVHFVDPGFSVTYEQMQAAMEAVRAYEAQTNEKIDLGSTQQVADAIRYTRDNKLLPPDKLERLETLSRQIVEKRLTDSDLHSNIMEATNGEKAAIIYGNLHDDIVRRLGPDTLVVDIYKDGRDFHDRSADLPNNRPGNGYGEPGLVHIVDDNQTFITDRATPQQSAGLTVEQGKQPPNGYFLGFIPIDPPSRTAPVTPFSPGGN